MSKPFYLIEAVIPERLMCDTLRLACSVHRMHVLLQPPSVPPSVPPFPPVAAPGVTGEFLKVEPFQNSLQALARIIRCADLEATEATEVSIVSIILS